MELSNNFVVVISLLSNPILSLGELWVITYYKIIYWVQEVQG